MPRRAAAPPSARPNVIVFYTDQQRWDTAGVHGNPLDLMPNFDRAACEGTHLFNSFTCQPVCAPSRASLQTGPCATSTGVFRNGIPLRRDLPTLARWFRGAGYRTAYIGKWHLASHPGVPRGPVAEADLSDLGCHFKTRTTSTSGPATSPRSVCLRSSRPPESPRLRPCTAVR